MNSLKIAFLTSFFGSWSRKPSDQACYLASIFDADARALRGPHRAGFTATRAANAVEIARADQLERLARAYRRAGQLIAGHEWDVVGQCGELDG